MTHEELEDMVRRQSGSRVWKRSDTV